MKHGIIIGALVGLMLAGSAAAEKEVAVCDFEGRRVIGCQTYAAWMRILNSPDYKAAFESERESGKCTVLTPRAPVSWVFGRFNRQEQIEFNDELVLQQVVVSDETRWERYWIWRDDICVYQKPYKKPETSKVSKPVKGK